MAPGVVPPAILLPSVVLNSAFAPRLQVSQKRLKRGLVLVHPSPARLGEALGGETKISYRPSPFCPSSQGSSNGERNPKANSEDDAVGAPRLVLRR